MTTANLTKLPARAETHRKYKAVAERKGWTLTKAVERIVDDYVAREAVADKPRRRRAS